MYPPTYTDFDYHFVMETVKRVSGKMKWIEMVDTLDKIIPETNWRAITLRILHQGYYRVDPGDVVINTKVKTKCPYQAPSNANYFGSKTECTLEQGHDGNHINCWRSPI